MLNKLDDKQFDELLNLVITYKKLHPKEDVYLTEKSIKKALDWYKNIQNNPSAGLLGK